MHCTYTHHKYLVNDSPMGMAGGLHHCMKDQHM